MSGCFDFCKAIIHYSLGLPLSSSSQVIYQINTAVIGEKYGQTSQNTSSLRQKHTGPHVNIENS